MIRFAAGAFGRLFFFCALAIGALYSPARADCPTVFLSVNGPIQPGGCGVVVYNGSTAATLTLPGVAWRGTVIDQGPGEVTLSGGAATVNGNVAGVTMLVGSGGAVSGDPSAGWQYSGPLASQLGSVTTQTGTSYTFAPTDCGTQINFTSNSAITATIPATLPVGCNIAILEVGTAKVSVNGSAVTAATLESASSYSGTRAQWSMIGISIEANAGGSSAVALLTGDGS
jgi:hypothetical protein